MHPVHSHNRAKPHLPCPACPAAVPPAVRRCRQHPPCRHLTRAQQHQPLCPWPEHNIYNNRHRFAGERLGERRTSKHIKGNVQRRRMKTRDCNTLLRIIWGGHCASGGGDNSAQHCKSGVWLVSGEAQGLAKPHCLFALHYLRHADHAGADHQHQKELLGTG